MTVRETAIPGLLVFTPRQFRDDRGVFMETFNDRALGELGIAGPWRQDNLSISKKNVVRGLHYQLIQPQGKLVRVVTGAALDVAVDVRRSSPTFGQHVAVELRAAEGTMLWIPPGFAHGFVALEENTGFAYKVTDYYCAAGERTVLWNDPALGIEWPVRAEDAIVSGKDAAGPRLQDAEVFA